MNERVNNIIALMRKKGCELTPKEAEMYCSLPSAAVRVLEAAAVFVREKGSISIHSMKLGLIDVYGMKIEHADATLAGLQDLGCVTIKNDMVTYVKDVPWPSLIGDPTRA
jgi:hypothetical protein